MRNIINSVTSGEAQEAQLTGNHISGMRSRAYHDFRGWVRLDEPTRNRRECRNRSRTRFTRETIRTADWSEAV